MRTCRRTLPRLFGKDRPFFATGIFYLNAARFEVIKPQDLQMHHHLQRLKPTRGTKYAASLGIVFAFVLSLIAAPFSSAASCKSAQSGICHQQCCKAKVCCTASKEQQPVQSLPAQNSSQELGLAVTANLVTALFTFPSVEKVQRFAGFTQACHVPAPLAVGCIRLI